jgi:hypothetical protein
MGLIPLISLYLIKPGFLKTKFWNRSLHDFFLIYEQYIITFVDLQDAQANHHS